MERFGTLIDEVHRYNVDKAYKLGRTVGINVFLNHSSFAIVILYGKKIIIDQEISSRMVNLSLLVIYLLFILLF